MHTIAELRAAYISGEKKPSEVIKEVFAVIEEKNDDVFAFFESHEVPQGHLTLKQTLEKLRVNTALREREKASFSRNLTR